MHGYSEPSFCLHHLLLSGDLCVSRLTKFIHPDIKSTLSHTLCILTVPEIPITMSKSLLVTMCICAITLGVVAHTSMTRTSAGENGQVKISTSDPIYFSILNTLLRNKISPSVYMPEIARLTNHEERCVSLLPNCAHLSRQPQVLLLVLSGDIETNPGPAGRPADYFPCGYCQLDVSWGCNGGVACDTCEVWYHISCHEINMSRYQRMQDPEVNLIGNATNVPLHSQTFINHFTLANVSLLNISLLPLSL